MTPCVCSHPRHWHLLQENECIDGCTCVQYHADDGSEQGTLVVPPRSNDYPPNSRYSTPRGGFDVS